MVAIEGGYPGHCLRPAKAWITRFTLWHKGWPPSVKPSLVSLVLLCGSEAHLTPAFSVQRQMAARDLHLHKGRLGPHQPAPRVVPQQGHERLRGPRHHPLSPPAPLHEVKGLALPFQRACGSGVCRTYHPEAHPAEASGFNRTYYAALPAVQFRRWALAHPWRPWAEFPCPESPRLPLPTPCPCQECTKFWPPLPKGNKVS